MNNIIIKTDNKELTLGDIIALTKGNDKEARRKILRTILTAAEVMGPLVIGVIGYSCFDQPASFLIGGGASVMLYCIEATIRDLKKEEDEINSLIYDMDKTAFLEHNYVDVTRLRKMNQQKWQIKKPI